MDPTLAQAHPADPVNAAPRGVLHVIGRSSELTDFLFEELSALADVRVITHPQPARRPWRSLLRAVEVYLLPWLPRSLCFDADYIARLRRIGPEDRVLFFAIDNRKDLQLVRKFIAARQIAAWFWNPIPSFRGHALSRWWFLHWLQRAGIRAYTFDPRDASEFGIGLTPQVFRHVKQDADDGPARPRTDVYFVGADKGRLRQLRDLESTLQAAGLSTLFHVVGDKRGRYDAEARAWLRREQISYLENLNQVQRSHAVLELLQSAQSGPTLRYVEALFLNRKLITNNRAILDAPGYDPSRHFILGVDDMAGLRRFLQRPLHPPSPGVLARHAIGSWLRHFHA